MRNPSTNDRGPTTPIAGIDSCMPEFRSVPSPDGESPNPVRRSCIEPNRNAADHSSARHVYEHPRVRGDVPIEVLQLREGVFLARFALDLVSVSSASLRSTTTQWSEHGTITPEEAARQRALTALACSLQPGQAIRFVHATHAHPGRPLRYRMAVEGHARASDRKTAIQRACDVMWSLRPALAAGVEHFRFAGQDPPAVRPHWLDRVEVVPAAICLEDRAGVAAGSITSRPRPRTLLPTIARQPLTFLESAVPGLLSLPAATELIVEWQGLRADAESIAAVNQDASALLDADSRRVRLTTGTNGPNVEVLPGDLQRTYAVLQAWLTDPVGARMRVWIRSAARVPTSLARIVGQELYSSRPFDIRRGAGDADMPHDTATPAIDLSGLITRDAPVPPLFPEPLCADAQGFERHFPFISFDPPPHGIVLGDSPGRDLAREITLADHDRAQHCCVVGSSGSGKTYGVLIPMVLQDMRRGAGVFNLCVAGDAHDYLVAACPPERMKDLVVLDFTDFTASPGLNLLQFQTKWPRVERGFIVGNLIETFKRQYPDVPEGFGPMFELYFTQAAYLAMEAQGSTVADIIRVFADPVYRRSLLAICRDPSVKVFWTNIAQRAGGEASLENMAPYIICKLTKLLDDEAVRRVVSQAESTLDLRALMDNRSICLIKISKGFLGEAGARFLGMVLLNRLFGAALSRADVPPDRRVPMHVYLDEAQNLLPALEGALAEGRKYGLRLTLGTQSLSSLPPGLAQSILTNCSTKIIMRSGPQDASILADWVEPHFGPADLVALPNRHTVARILVDGILSPPFVMRTRELPEIRPSAELDARLAAIKADSRRRYCVDAEVIDQRIEARQSALPATACG